MKNFITVALLFTASALGGCATTGAYGQYGHDASAVFDNPVTGGIVGAVVGNAIDRTVFNGNGDGGMLIGGAVGYAMGERRDERIRQQRQTQTNCQVSQQGYYNGHEYVVTSENRDCGSTYSAQGWRNYPDQSRVRYETERNSSSSSQAPGRQQEQCQRYRRDGSVDENC